jgi:hypothetical protein
MLPYKKKPSTGPKSAFAVKPHPKNHSEALTPEALKQARLAAEKLKPFCITQ